jgi:hypothetical protein
MSGKSLTPCPALLKYSKNKWPRERRYAFFAIMQMAFGRIDAPA